MGKFLEDLSVAEMRHELRSRQMDSKGPKAELQERLQSWILDQGQDPDEYFFVDPSQKMMEQIQASINKLRNSLGIEIKTLNFPGETVKEASLNKAATTYQLEETPKSTEDTTPAGESALHPIAALVSVETKTEEMVNGSTLGEIKVLLPWSEESGKKLREKLGEEVEAEETLAEVIVDSLVVDVDSPIEEPHTKVESVVNNNELGENLANVNEFTPVSGEPVPCPIASLVSVEKKTEVMIEGEVEPPCVEESVEELDLGDSGERFELEVAEFNSAVDVVKIEAADTIAVGGDVNSEVSKAEKVESMTKDRVGEVLSSDEAVDCATSPIEALRTLSLGEPVRDHPVVLSYETVDFLKMSVAEIRVEPHELLVLLFIMFGNLIGMTFGTGGDPATEGSLVHRQSKDSVPRVKMKNRWTMVNSLFGTNRFKEGAML